MNMSNSNVLFAKTSPTQKLCSFAKFAPTFAASNAIYNSQRNSRCNPKVPVCGGSGVKIWMFQGLTAPTNLVTTNSNALLVLIATLKLHTKIWLNQFPTYKVAGIDFFAVSIVGLSCPNSDEHSTTSGIVKKKIWPLTNKQQHTTYNTQ